MSDRVRVLQVISGFKPGGAERLLLHLVAALDKSRFEVRVVSLSPHLEALEVYGSAVTEVTVFDIAQDRWQNLRNLVRFINGFQPNVIHAHMFHGLLAAVAASALGACRPAICFTGHRTVHTPWRQSVLRALRGRRNIDVLFSDETHSPVDAERTVVIPNGVTVSDGLPARREWRQGEHIRLLTVGRLIDVKDCLGLVRSFAAAGLERATLTFLGNGPLKREISRLANELGVGAHVVLGGFSVDVRMQMRAADLLVMHSRQEGMPMALLEAGAEAMPVIATPVGSIPAILGTNRGILATPTDFPDALRCIAATSRTAIAMGERLRAHIAAHYSITATVRAHERLYEELAAEVALARGGARRNAVAG